MRRTALAVGLYLVLAVVSFYPQSLRPWDTVGYVGDSLESVYLIAWNVHQFFRAPWRLFDANFLFPQPQPLTFTDHQLLSSLSVAPVLWATGNPVLAYNVAVLLASLLAALAGRAVARGLGTSEVGAWAAGALYGFHTYQVNEAPRIQIIFHGFLALALFELVRYLRTGERAAAVRTAVLMLLQALCSNYLLLYGCVLLAVVVGAFLAARPGPTLRRLPLLAAAGVVAGTLYLPVGLPYVLSSRAWGYERPAPEGIDLRHYLSTSPNNLVYGPMGAPFRPQMLGPHFVGFVSLGLAGLAVGAWALRRGGEPPRALLPVRVYVPAAAALALLLVALSLGQEARVFGHDLGPGPYRLLWRWVPGFHLMRLPERLSLLAMLFVGLLAGRGLDVVRQAGLRAPVVLLAALVPLEHVSPLFQTERVPVWGKVPTVYRWLAAQPARAVAEVPTHGEGQVRMESLEMYFSSYHWKPIIHGYASYPTLLDRLLRRTAGEFPSETSLQVFARVGVDTVVVHHGRPEAVDLYHQLQGSRRRRLGELRARAGLDLFARLPAAVAEGRIRREERFEGPSAHVYEGTADEVYRITTAADPGPAAPLPGGRVRRDPAWRWEASRGRPALAGDGRLETSWAIDYLRGDESLAVLFPRPVAVVGVAIPLRWDTVLPTRFVVEGRNLEGRWSPLARWGRATTLQLLEQLLTRPREAVVGFAFAERQVTGVRLAVEAGGTSFDGWTVPELEIRVP